MKKVLYSSRMIKTLLKNTDRPSLERILNKEPRKNSGFASHYHASFSTTRPLFVCIPTKYTPGGNTNGNSMSQTPQSTALSQKVSSSLPFISDKVITISSPSDIPCILITPGSILLIEKSDPHFTSFIPSVLHEGNKPSNP